MNATLAGDYKTGAEYASHTVAECTDIFADVLYTLYLLDKGEKGLSGNLNLPDLAEESWHCDGMFNFLPQKNFLPSKKWDEPLPIDIGNGPRSGIGLLPDMYPFYPGIRHAYIQYRIPRGVFHKLTFRCGLNKTSEQNDTYAIFQILLDGKTVWESPALGANAEPYYSEVPLGDAETLRLQVRDAREDASETKFFYPCFTELYLQRD